MTVMPVRPLTLRVWPTVLAAHLLTVAWAGLPIRDPELWALFRWTATVAAVGHLLSAAWGGRWPWPLRLAAASATVGALVGRGAWMLVGSQRPAADRMVASSAYLALATATVALTMSALLIAEREGART